MIRNVTTLLIILFNISSFAQHTLNVNVTGIKNNNGNIKLAIYDKEDGFAEIGKEIKGYMVKANTKGVTFKITDLASGNYAFAIFHDANNNNQLDKNRIGIPKEGFGFSYNTTPKLSPPNWNKSVFNFPKTNTFQIELFGK